MGVVVFEYDRSRRKDAAKKEKEDARRRVEDDLYLHVLPVRGRRRGWVRMERVGGRPC